MNFVILSGRIATDLSMSYTSNNTPMVTFNLAVRQPYKTYGEYGVDFIRCKTFRQTAENLIEYKQKGNFIEVSGALSVREYTRDGETTKRYITEVIVKEITYPPIKDDINSDGNEYSKKEESNSKVENLNLNEDDLPF